MKSHEFSINGKAVTVQTEEGSEVQTRAFGSHVLVSSGEFGFAGEIQGLYLYRMMYECIVKKWTGAFHFYLPDGNKKVYFRNGDVVFATSEVMEDRLGEVLFRQGRLSLEVQMDCAVRVTKDKRFGQVLLQSEVFDHAELMQSLCLQVQQIFRSFFQYPVVCVEVKDAVSAPQEIVMLEDPIQILQTAS